MPAYIEFIIMAIWFAAGFFAVLAVIFWVLTIKIKARQAKFDQALKDWL